MARTFCLLALLALVVAGCDPGTNARKKMEGPSAPTWPALQAVQGEGGLMAVGMSLDTQGPSAAKQAAATPRFKELLDGFEKAPIPSEFSTAAREAAKKDIVETMRKFPDAASDAEVKELWQKVRGAMMKVGSP